MSSGKQFCSLASNDQGAHSGLYTGPGDTMAAPEQPAIRGDTTLAYNEIPAYDNVAYTHEEN